MLPFPLAVGFPLNQRISILSVDHEHQGQADLSHWIVIINRYTRRRWPNRTKIVPSLTPVEQSEI